MTAPTLRVGLVGLGIMGSAMATHLLRAGFAVTGHDIRDAAIQAFAGMGGRAVASAAEVARVSDVVLTSLPSVAALETVLASLEAAGTLGCIIAETSTFALQDKLAAQARLSAIDVSMLDCPLSGSGEQAKTRDVLVYGSGPRSAYDRCLPAFQAFSRAPHYVGTFGSGSKMKFVANLLVAIHTAAAGEAFALARRAGLDPQQTFDLVADGAGGSRALQVRGPMLVAETYLPVRTMPLDLWRKDMGVIADFANSLACPTPLFSAAIPLFNAAIACGYGEHDTAAVCAAIERMAGLDPPR